MGWRSEAGGGEEAVKDWVMAWAKSRQWAGGTGASEMRLGDIRCQVQAGVVLGFLVSDPGAFLERTDLERSKASWGRCPALCECEGHVDSLEIVAHPSLKSSPLLAPPCAYWVWAHKMCLHPGQDRENPSVKKGAVEKLRKGDKKLQARRGWECRTLGCRRGGQWSLVRRRHKQRPQTWLLGLVTGSSVTALGQAGLFGEIGL